MWERKRENRYWMEGGKEGAECAMKRERQLSTCGMDVAKCEKGRQKGDKMDERDMEEEGREREGKGWGIAIEKVIFGKCLLGRRFMVFF
jgi:hypothetical protein